MGEDSRDPALVGPVFGEVWDVAVRGYNRRDVDDFAEHARRQVADLEERLARALGEAERLRAELATARQPPVSRPAHEEVSERIGQIFTLADEETQAEKDHAAQAMALLRKAVDGFRDIRTYRTEGALDPLREREDFKKLLTELEQKSAAKPK